MEAVFGICGNAIAKYINACDRLSMYIVGLFDLRATLLPSSQVSVTEQVWFYNGIFLLVNDTRKRQKLLHRCHELDYTMNYESFMMLLLVHNNFSMFKYVHDLKNIKYNVETLRIVSRFGNVKWMNHIMIGINNNNTYALDRNNKNCNEIRTSVNDMSIDTCANGSTRLTGTNSNNKHPICVNFNDVGFTGIMKFCAQSCYFDCVMLMLRDYKCIWDEHVVAMFIQHGHVEGYMYLLKNNYTLTDIDAMDCITHNRFNWFITYVRQHDKVLGSFVNDYIDNCITHDRLDILKYIMSILSYTDMINVSNACRMELAAMHSVRCLRYLYKKSNRRWLSKHVTVQAMRTGNLQCLKFAHVNNCEWHIDTMKNAARYGHLECMIYAYKHNCPWGQNVATVAITFGNYDCLRYAINHGCPHTIL